MNSRTQSTQDAKYSDLIRKIRRQQKLIIVLTLVAIFAVVFFTTPTHIEIMGKPIIDHDGLPSGVILLLVLLCYVIELFAAAIVALPLHTSMSEECDPEKQLILNKHLNKRKHIDHIYAIDHLYLGNYQEALLHAEIMIASKREAMVISGRFHKARCEFFLEDFEALRQTVKDYTSALATQRTLKPKAVPLYQTMQLSLDLLVALADNDTEAIERLRHSVTAWTKTKGAEGYIDYLKGIAAYAVGDRDECLYRLKAVKDRMPKTVFARLADEQLALLQ